MAAPRAVAASSGAPVTAVASALDLRSSSAKMERVPRSALAESGPQLMALPAACADSVTARYTRMRASNEHMPLAMNCPPA